MPRQNRRITATLPRLRTPPAIPVGPRLYRPRRDRGYRGGPGEPPPGFVRGTTSRTEWWCYWAFFKALNIPADPRNPPFTGFANVLGYQVGTRELGGAVADFIVYAPRRSFGERQLFRIQTEYRHVYVDSARASYDLLQAWRLSSYNRVIDLYDYEFMEDPTGQSIIVLIKRGLAGETYSPPGATGIAQRVRPGRRMP